MSVEFSKSVEIQAKQSAQKHSIQHIPKTATMKMSTFYAPPGLFWEETPREKLTLK